MPLKHLDNSFYLFYYCRANTRYKQKAHCVCYQTNTMGIKKYQERQPAGL